MKNVGIGRFYRGPNFLTKVIFKCLLTKAYIFSILFCGCLAEFMATHIAPRKVSLLFIFLVSRSVRFLFVFHLASTNEKGLESIFMGDGVGVCRVKFKHRLKAQESLVIGKYLKFLSFFWNWIGGERMKSQLEMEQLWLMGHYHVEFLGRS